uniref:Cytochrome P450 2L1-like n=1 Tax=Hirondellea gigas TaxID=1518452 RepID=A0A2P2I3B0_9CRUS
MILEVILLLALVAILVYKKTAKPATMPPGSFGWPVIGSLPPLQMPITQHLSNLKKQYGNIITTKWGSIPIVVLADYQLIKKAFNHPDFQGRPNLFSFQLYSYFRNYGVGNSVGKVWADNRRFLLRHLRTLGMGKTHAEDSIQYEAKMLVEYLEEHNLDKPSEMDWSLNVAVLNVIWQMMASKRYAADDEEIVNYNKMVTEDFDIVQGPVFLLDVMPWLNNVLPNFIKNNVMKVDVLMRHRDEFYNYCLKMFDEHKKNLDPENPRDIIDYYLLEIEANKDDPDTTFISDPGMLHSVVNDMFTAGSETSATTLRWMILYMAVKPEIQSKIHKLLDAVVPSDRLPSLDDREQLAYIDAMLLDLMRISSLVPISLPHCATATVQFEGYTIPKGTMLLVCAEMCHRDPAVWKCPDDLYPEHFLDEDGKLDSKKDSFLPFSIGRRQCLGESLARMELFLFASAILQRFTIQPPPGVTLSTSTDPAMKLLNSPKPYKVVLKKRH